MDKFENLKKERELLLQARETATATYDTRLREIDDAMWQERVINAEKHVGECFKTTDNSYCGDNKYWNVYSKILRVVHTNEIAGEYFVILEIAKDSRDMYIIQTKFDSIVEEHSSIFGYHKQDAIKITSEEFNQVLNEYTTALKKEAK